MNQVSIVKKQTNSPVISTDIALRVKYLACKKWDIPITLTLAALFARHVACHLQGLEFLAVNKKANPSASFNISFIFGPFNLRSNIRSYLRIFERKLKGHGTHKNHSTI